MIYGRTCDSTKVFLLTYLTGLKRRRKEFFKLFGVYARSYCGCVMELYQSEEQQTIFTAEKFEDIRPGPSTARLKNRHFARPLTFF